VRKIIKGDEPASLSAWKRRRANNNKTYNDLGHSERQDIRAQCTEEQFYLCAYCCARISGENHDTMNEHIQARDIFPNLSLDYANIVASCTTSNQCDDSHQNQGLPLTPLMGECETELKFYISGRVKGLTPRAEETIRVLNLGDDEANNEKIIRRRRAAIESLLGTYGRTSSDWQLEDDDTLELMAEDLDQPRVGKLEPFAPILKQILQDWLA
jgi:uncharacterized protein (TIGR02646 family)